MKNYFKVILAGLIVVIAVSVIMSNQTDNAHSEGLTIYEKIAEGRTYNYLIVGDSIGRGSGAETTERRWFNQLELLIKDRYGAEGVRQSIVQSGATSFEGIYKFQHAPESETMDLIFIVFGENDRKYMEAEDFSFFYEKLLINTKHHYPGAEVITFVESSLKRDDFADVIKQLSQSYGAKSMDMRIPFYKSGKSTNQLTTDSIHPNGLGYELYASTVFEYMNGIIASGQTHFSEEQASIEPLYLEAVSKVATNSGFLLQNGYYANKKPGDILEYEFSGTLLGVTLLRHPDGGMMNVYIDGEYIRTLSTWWPFSRERYIYLASGLENTRHTVRFEAVKEKSGSNTEGGSLLTIASIIVEKQ